MSPYAAVVGIPPADISDVNATWEGRIVQRSAAPKINMIVTALRGCRASSTRPIQEERGRTPSRAIAKMSREAATIATLVLCKGITEVRYAGEKRKIDKRRTRISPREAITVMTTLPPFPSARA